MSNFIRPTEAGRMLEVSRVTIHNMVKAGKLTPAVLIDGKGILFNPSYIQEIAQ